MVHEFRGTNFWDTLYFTFVCLWCGRTLDRAGGVRSRDYQIFSDG